MNVEAVDDAPQGLEDLIKQALITRCSLTPEDIESIMQARSSLHMNFAEAALHIGLVTRDDVDQVADEIVMTESQRRPGIIEMALRRQASTRIVALRHSDVVSPSKRLILAHDMVNERSERLRALRTELLLLNQASGLANVIALLSPGSGEGRSQLCAELAIAFAQLGRRTLLLDADLRNPSQHLLFNAPNRWGLSQALTSSDRPMTCGVEGLPHLSLLTAGTQVPNPLELLSGDRVQRLLSDWRHDQEFIIIDTPPVSQYADGLAMAMLAGKVLVINRAQVTRHTDMKEMLRRLSTTQSQILGAVINHF